MSIQNKTDVGLIGLAVMGENLALNMASKGWNVSVYNRTVPGVEEGVVERFLNGRAKGLNIEGFTDIAAFVDSIALPRKIMMMVRAGSAVDELMEQLFPLLSPGDILIDSVIQVQYFLRFPSPLYFYAILPRHDRVFQILEHQRGYRLLLRCHYVSKNHGINLSRKFKTTVHHESLIQFNRPFRAGTHQH